MSFKWKKEHDEAFNELKRMLFSAPTPTLPNFENNVPPFVLDTNQGDIAVGGVYPQSDREGREHTIAHANARLNRKMRQNKTEQKFVGLKKYYRRKKYELGFSGHPVPVYKNQFTTPIHCHEGGCCCRGRDFPLDSLLKAICCAIGITGEVYTGFHDGKFEYLTNAQHATMFAMFMLAGIFELLNFYHVFGFARCNDYFFNFLALVTECVLFAFHLHGRTPTDVYVHTILIYALVILIVVGLCEAVFVRSLTAGLVRSLIIIVEGSWFWQVGAILYPPITALPVWDELAIESIPRSTNIFIWHIICGFGFVCLAAAIMGIPLRNPPANANASRNDQRRLLAGEDAVDSDDSGSETEILEMRQWKVNY